MQWTQVAFPMAGHSLSYSSGYDVDWPTDRANFQPGKSYSRGKHQWSESVTTPGANVVGDFCSVNHVDSGVPGICASRLIVNNIGSGSMTCSGELEFEQFQWIAPWSNWVHGKIERTASIACHSLEFFVSSGGLWPFTRNSVPTAIVGVRGTAIGTYTEKIFRTGRFGEVVVNTESSGTRTTRFSMVISNAVGSPNVPSTGFGGFDWCSQPIRWLQRSNGGGANLDERLAGICDSRRMNCTYLLVRATRIGLDGLRAFPEFDPLYPQVFFRADPDFPPVNVGGTDCRTFRGTDSEVLLDSFIQMI